MALRNLKVTPSAPLPPVLGLDGTPRERQAERFGQQPMGQRPPGDFVSVNPADRDSYISAALAAAPSLAPQPSAQGPETAGVIANALATAKKPGFFDSNGGWKSTLGTIGDIVSGMVGGPMLYHDGKVRQRNDLLLRAKQAREDQIRQEDRTWHVQDRDALLNKPEYFMSGRDRVKFDPASGDASVIYDGPEDYQTYAQTIGLSPDTPDYASAVQDYVLKGNGPTSQAARRALDSQRNTQRIALRGMPTYAQTHPRPRSGGGGGGGAPKSANAVIAPLLLKMAQGGTLTPAEQSAMAYAKGGSGRGRGGGGGASASAGLPVVRSPAEARQLPKGSKFQTPDGSVRVVQ
jgi:hypothetical protein